jgi:hypothetical protein
MLYGRPTRRCGCADIGVKMSPLLRDLLDRGREDGAALHLAVK